MSGLVDPDIRGASTLNSEILGSITIAVDRTAAWAPVFQIPPLEFALIPESESRHRLAAGAHVLAKSVLAGLHHEYLLATAPASG
jgi:hypothetical protein